MTPRALAALALVAAGVFFTFVAAVGLYRLPDVYSRAHATSKSDTLGTALALSGAAVAFDDGTVRLKLVLLVAFVLVTGPTAAHAVVRSAHVGGVEPWTQADGDGPRTGRDGEHDSRPLEDG